MRRLLPLLLVLLVASTSPAAPSMYRRAVSLVERRYLDPDGFDPVAAFEEAAEAVEDAVDWLVVEPEDGTVALSVGRSEPFARVSIDEERAADDLAAALERLEAAIASAPRPLPGDVDLPVELLAGMARALDRHSVVLARRRLARFDERIRGKLTGIGARIGRVDGELAVREVFEGTPAAAGGLRADDVILAVDGISTLGMSVAQCVSRIRGPEGTPVVLRVRRVEDGGEVVRELRFVRAEIDIPVVRSELRPSGVAVVSIDHFSDHTAAQLRRALDEVPGVRGIVLDLRGNSGGSMIQACRVVDQFLEEGEVIRTVGRGGERVDNLLPMYRAHDEDTEPDAPLVVLVDHGTASASEIVAGTLVLRERAVLLGERTHGKGTVQKLFTLRGGDEDERVRFKLTVARYLVGGDHPIRTGEGLEPDLDAEPAVFSRRGAWLPEDDAELVYVVERPGWRAGEIDEDEERGDFLVELAERVVLEARGPSRAETLAALERLLPEVQREEEARLERTFALRGLDWRPAEDAVDAPPDVAVQVETDGPAVAGRELEVRATVRNAGPAPLYRVRVVLAAEDPHAPWDGLVLPVGYLPPEAEGVGTALVRLDDDLPDREDLVRVRVRADRRPEVEAAPVLLRVRASPPPPVAASVRVVPDGEELRAEVHVENLGDGLLTGVRATFGIPDDGSVVLLDREGRVDVLAPGEDRRADVRLQASPGDGPLDLELRVAAEVYGTILRVPVALPRDGAPVRVEPPRVEVEAPLSAEPGRVTVSVRATDDRGLRSLVAWEGRQKLDWREGQGRSMRVRLPVEIEEGANTLSVVVTDEEGARTRRVVVIRGRGGQDAAAAE